jgi:hypothetical protein
VLFRAYLYVYCARALGRCLNVKFHLLLFGQGVEFGIHHAGLMKKDFSAVRIADKAETSIADYLFNFTGVHLISPFLP